MADFNSMQYGTSKSGVNSLHESIPIEPLTEQILDISTIKEACNNNWEGVSKDKFLAALENDVNMLEKNIIHLYRLLDREISAVYFAYDKFDQNLIEE